MKVLAVAVDTACSSALVALHAGRQCLMEGGAAAATAAGMDNARCKLLHTHTMKPW